MLSAAAAALLLLRIKTYRGCLLLSRAEIENISFFKKTEEHFLKPRFYWMLSEKYVINILPGCALMHSKILSR